MIVYDIMKIQLGFRNLLSFITLRLVGVNKENAVLYRLS